MWERDKPAVRMLPAVTLLVATHVAVIQASLEMGLTAMVKKSDINDEPIDQLHSV